MILLEEVPEWNLYSPATEVYETKPLGPSLSPPIIKQFTSLDHSHVAVFWLPGRFKNGPIIHYRLKLFQRHHVIDTNYFSDEIIKEKVKST